MQTEPALPGYTGAEVARRDGEGFSVHEKLHLLGQIRDLKLKL